jgi:hypothetical protein
MPEASQPVAGRWSISDTTGKLTPNLGTLKGFLQGCLLDQGCSVFFRVALLREEEPLAPHSDQLLIFCFRKMGFRERKRSTFHKCSVSSIRNRTTALSRSNWQSATLQLRLEPDTSGNSFSEEMPLFTHTPHRKQRGAFFRVD